MKRKIGYHNEKDEDDDSALKSGPVSVLLPFLEGPQTGPVSESFRMQEPRTGTTKNRKKPQKKRKKKRKKKNAKKHKKNAKKRKKTQKTGCNWSQNEYIKTRAISVKIGHKL